MPVKTRPQPLLIQIMRNQTNGAAEHKQSIQNTVLEVVFCLFWAESTAVAEEVDEANGDAAVDIEDEVVFFGGCDGFHSNGVVEEFSRGEVLLAELFDERDTKVGVVAGFDTVADSRD